MLALYCERQCIRMGIFCLAEIQAVLTVLSLSAIVSNGAMRGLQTGQRAPSL